jgi:3-hydroxymyristoyl/3-hydroxydecanoyl-(acyl carrier protein) dehydratase
MKKSMTYNLHPKAVELPELSAQSSPEIMDHPQGKATAIHLQGSQVQTEAPQYPGPKFSREDLETLANGKISSKFGEWFKELDQYRRLIRMPKPPLLLPDRVLGIDADPGSFEKGRLWTETDVQEDSWYLHNGRMPLALMIEAGQADLLLISWLGFDFYNRNDRVYRLLSAEVLFFGESPKPGDRLHFEIRLDGHAKQGDIRLFFFSYNCHINGELRMKLRNGQAGFFTDEELKSSGGVLWDPDTARYDKDLPVEPPSIHCKSSTFSKRQIENYADGDVYGCFGEGFEYAQTHTQTPNFSRGKLLFLDEITHFDVKGGPWGRGYIRALQKIDPNDWFFKGHFKNDPCMPGTLMLEGGLQAILFYMTGIGYTIDKDGWRLEAIPNQTYKLVCRGQITPTSREVVYEVFVYGCTREPFPTLHVDLLGTVDGLKAFHTKMSVKLVPDWPLNTQFKRIANTSKNPIVGSDGFVYDYRSLLACSLGKPSQAFGSMYTPFDNGKRVARLPGPPYHFISRIVSINAEKESVKAGGTLTVELDLDPKAWYFKRNNYLTLPFCVLLEAGLQPCGWLASFLGCALTSSEELFYRNLDGTGKQLREITPEDRTIRTQVTCSSLSKISSMIIIGFNVKCFIEDELVYFMDTVFGFFPAASFSKQEGLPTSSQEKQLFEAPSDFYIDLMQRPYMYCGNSLRLPDSMLLMIDRITGYWPDQGTKKLGVLRAEKKVQPDEWFFKAHFFQDPVQPGSLGIEAMIQLLQFYMLHKNLHKRLANPHFEPIAIDHALSWKYRGQVVPDNQCVHVLADIQEEGQDARGFPYVKANISLWVDGKRIYEAKELGLRIVESEHTSPKLFYDHISLDLARTPKLVEYRPSFGMPVAPLKFLLDKMTDYAEKYFLHKRCNKIDNVHLFSWLVLKPFNTIFLTIEIFEDNCAKVILSTKKNDQECKIISGDFYFVEKFLGEPEYKEINIAKEAIERSPFNGLPKKDVIAFCIDQQYIPSIHLSTFEENSAFLACSTITKADWIPGTLAAVFQVEGNIIEMTQQILIKEYFGRMFKEHPATIVVLDEGSILRKSDPGKIYYCELTQMDAIYHVRASE